MRERKRKQRFIDLTYKVLKRTEEEEKEHSLINCKFREE